MTPNIVSAHTYTRTCNVLQYGAEAEGVVYPREVVVSVELDPGSIACSDVTTDDTNCTVSITGDNVYTVSLTLRNDVGSTQAALKMFNCELKC